MNVCVSGLWHLGTVTAACLAAAGHQVTGLDMNPEVVAQLARGTPPLFEPGLAESIRDGIDAGRLDFTADARAAVARADVVWITADTPVDENDRADVDSVVRAAADLFPYLREGVLVLVSSQVPVGTTARLERLYISAAGSRQVRFAYVPENLRLGTAIQAFTHPDRVVVGTRSIEDRVHVAQLLQPFTDRIEWMSVESAEMTKHALNAFLATSVTFINEVATLCEQTGADAFEVERGLKSDARVGPRAYLSPGQAFAGGTLARDVRFLSGLGEGRGIAAPLLASIRHSNEAHAQWPQRRLAELLVGGLDGKTVAVWGLTYKPGTDTLRRSTAIGVCEWLNANGAVVQAHDPAVRELPPNLRSRIRLADDPLVAVDGANALVVATSWPEFRSVDAEEVARRMADKGLVLDAGGFLAGTLGSHPRLRYVRVGTPLT